MVDPKARKIFPRKLVTAKISFLKLASIHFTRKEKSLSKPTRIKLFSETEENN